MSNNNKGQKILSEKKPPNANENNNNNNINENADSNIYSIDNNEVLDNLIKLSGNQEVYKELKEETSKIKQILSQSREKLRLVGKETECIGKERSVQKQAEPKSKENH